MIILIISIAFLIFLIAYLFYKNVYLRKEKELLELKNQNLSAELLITANLAEQGQVMFDSLLKLSKKDYEKQIIYNKPGIFIIARKNSYNHWRGLTRNYFFKLILLDVFNKEEVCECQVEVWFKRQEQVDLESNTKIITPYGWLEILAIDTPEEHRRKGYASELLKYLEEYGELHFFSEMRGRLDPFSNIGDDALRVFYLKNGFIIQGETIKKVIPQRF